ncbi:TPA: hypothetical protein H7B12_002555 [Escherichia coli]|nr:hypothetical protein [Escherichia coli]
MSIKNDGHYFCRAGGNRPDGLNEPVTEYKHVAHDGMPWDNSPCFYNLEEIDRWIERQASARPRRHLT